jgi:flagellar L-ring protein precursor FlgH
LKELDSMPIRGHISRTLVASFFFVLAVSIATAGNNNDKDKDKKKKQHPAASSLDDYLSRVRAMGAEQPATTGSLWVSSGPLSNASSDYKARFAGDLITVQLVDTFSAATAGENNTSRQFATQSAITGLLGKIGPNNAMQNLLAANSNTALDGKGSSTMSSNLQLNLAGRVVEVMPNGVLVVEAARDFTVDIAPNNSVVSSAITSLELEIKGKGSVADASARPNILVRTVLKLLTF